MTFHSIVRQWCKIYKPMLDSTTNGNRRFYLTDTKEGLVELAKNLEPKMSPSVIMESTVEGSGEIRRPSRNYPIYFFVRARDMADGDAATEAKEEAWWHCQNFLTWLLGKREEELEQNIDGDFSKIELDGSIIFDTIGPVGDGWYAVLVQFDREEPLNLCVNEDLYIDPDVEPHQSEQEEEP